MPERLTIDTVTGPVKGTVRPPGSKSITNRALVCAALAKGTSRLSGALASDDTQVMIESLGRLGIAVRSGQSATELEVDGQGGRIPSSAAELYIGNSGTTVRFLTAMLTLGHGHFRLDGKPRMRERPIGDLADALRQLGADLTCESPGSCPPVLVRGHGLTGGTATVRGDISSQFLSGLLQTVPLADGAVRLRVEGELVSQPYIHMTLAVMRAFGVTGQVATDLSEFAFAGSQSYVACDYAIEPDASAASYLWAAAAVTGGRVTVAGLDRSSLQGDVAFVDELAKMGCTVESIDGDTVVTGGQLRGISTNMNAISDTVQTLAAVALFAEGPTEIGGVGHIRHKETDRLAALCCELRRLGAEVDEHPDGLRIHPRPLRPAEIRTYDDHRMAMSLALVGLRSPGVTILDPGCTAKTYPDYFADLRRLATSS